MEKLFLLGIKHSGKTTLMKALSAALSVTGADSDDLLASRFSPLTVREWYRENGKERFMEEETAAVRAFLEENREKDLILSLGGGASDNAPLLSLLGENGKLIYIRRSADDLFPMIMKDGLPPFLSEDDPRGSFDDLYMRRDSIYSDRADITVSFDGWHDKAEETETLLSALREAL